MFVEFKDNSIKVREALEDGVLQFLEEAAAEIESAAIRNTRVDTGQLKGQWMHTLDDAKLEATVGNTLENAIWEELGTGEYAVKRNGRKGAWYIPVDRVTGKKKPTYNGEVIIVHGKNGMDFYKTNGKKPKRMLHTAFEKNKNKIIKRAEEVLKGRMK